jgi:hypothetical protein
MVTPFPIKACAKAVAVWLPVTAICAMAGVTNNKVLTQSMSNDKNRELNLNVFIIRMLKVNLFFYTGNPSFTTKKYRNNTKNLSNITAFLS